MADETGQLRKAVVAWFHARTRHTITQEDVERDPSVGRVGQRILDRRDVPYPTEGEALAKALDQLAQRAARAELDAKPALRLSRALRRRGYTEADVDYDLIDEAMLLADELDLRAGSRGPAQAPSKRTQEKAAKKARLRTLLLNPNWRDGKRSALAKELDISERALRGYLSELRAEDRQ